VADRYGVAPPGYRLPDATSIGSVRLQVADLSRSVEYYRDVLGLQVLSRSDHAAALGPRESARTLVELVERRRARPVPRGGHLGLYHFAILLPDRPSLGRFVEHLARAGVAAGSADHAVSEAIYLRDPDGLGIEVYADRPRQAWRRGATGEIYMTTEPLNLHDVIAAGDGVAWSGMPGSTEMGHVHLHVGSLEEAEAFYHRALGFDKMVWSYPGALFLAAGGYHHHLGTNTWSTGRSPEPGDARLLSWSLIVPALADGVAAAESLRAAGRRVIEHDGQWTVSDPWGTELQVVTREHATAPRRSQAHEHGYQHAGSHVSE
jgi:catechol 2,3-dioxygenase